MMKHLVAGELSYAAGFPINPVASLYIYLLAYNNFRALTLSLGLTVGSCGLNQTKMY